MKTQVTRKTKETQIHIALDNAPGPISVTTELPFFDHMLGTLARYAGWSLRLEAKWDLKHHCMEDVAIALGTAVAKIIPENAARFGERTVPMDDALVQAVVDVGGRFYYRGGLKNDLYEHWFRSFAEHAKSTLHLRLIRGKDSHHSTEACFKALGLALRDAMSEGGEGGVFSTKGSVDWEII